MFRVRAALAAALLLLAACGDADDAPEARQADDGRRDCEWRDVDDGTLTVEEGRPCAGMDLRQVSVGAVDALHIEVTVDDDRSDPPVAWGVAAIVHVPAPDPDGDEPPRWFRLRCRQEHLEAGVVVDNGPFQRIELQESPEPGCRRERAKILVTVAFDLLAVEGAPAAGRSVEVGVATTARIPGRAYPRLIDRLAEPVIVEIPSETDPA